MSEVLEKKRLELNEKVDFSLASVGQEEEEEEEAPGARSAESFRGLGAPLFFSLQTSAGFRAPFLLFPSMRRQKVGSRPSGSNATPRASSYQSVNWGVWEPAKGR